MLGGSSGTAAAGSSFGPWGMIASTLLSSLMKSKGESSGGGGLAELGGSGWMGNIGTGLNMLSSAEKLVGPKGALRTGDIVQGGQAVQNLYQGGNSMFGSSDPNPGPRTPTTQGAFKMTPEQFMGLPPAVREKMLRQLSEETNAFGSIR